MKETHKYRIKTTNFRYYKKTILKIYIMNESISNRVNVLVKKTYYTYDRFGVDATFALLYHII